MVTLNIEKRDTKAKPEALREKGVLPAVYYGKKTKSTPVAVSSAQFLKAWREAGESTVVNLKLDGDGELQALIHDVELDPVTDVPTHADFYVFEKGQKVEVAVPIEFVGESPAVKNLGAIIIKVLHELTVEAEPKDLPHEIVVDISSLVDLESVIEAKDVKLPTGVTLVDNPEEIIASVDEAKEEEEVPAEAPDLSTIEVEKKGKQEEEGEEGAEAPETKKEEKK